MDKIDAGSCANTRSLKSMSSLSVMEWNAKPPLQWEWESAAAPITSKATENTKIWPSIDWGMDVDEQIASGSLISYQGDCGSGVSSGGTSFDLGYASMSKSSKSTSMTSSSTEDKMFKLSVEAACKVHSEDFISKKDDFSGTSPTFESSVCSGEPLLSLKLGKRAYFEDISEGNNSKTTSAFPVIARSPVISAKRTRSTFQSIPAACCQVEGCNLDLSSAKDYHRKHKVCANHSKSTKVIVNGVERRFCQQCSRFHGLAEFDENKRSCRKRLSDHNARRRRPHPNVAHFNPTSLSTIIYGGGMQHVTPVFGRIPVEQNSKSSSNNITWSNTSSSINFKAAAAAAVKHEAVGGPLAEAARHGNMLLFDSVSRKKTTVTELSGDGSYGLVPLNGATVKIHGGGGSAEETSLISSSQPPQDLHRALSLLSTDARDSSRPRSLPVPVSPQGPHLQADNIATGVVKPWTYGVPQSSPPPLASSAPHELWHAEEEQWSSNSQRVSMNHHHHHQNAGNGNNFNNGNAFQECLLSEGQHEFGFDLMMHLN